MADFVVIDLCMVGLPALDVGPLCTIPFFPAVACLPFLKLGGVEITLLRLSFQRVELSVFERAVDV